MLSLARSVIERNSFANVAQPVLDRLSREWGVTAIGVEISGLDHMVVVTLSRSQMPFSLHLDVGSRFPALISATGRLNAAFSDRPWSEIEQGFRRLRWQNAPDLTTWRTEVEAVRRKGYSIDRGNYISGVTIVAVPLFDTSKRVGHAIVAAGVADQLDSPRSIALAKQHADRSASAVRIGACEQLAMDVDRSGHFRLEAAHAGWLYRQRRAAMDAQGR